MRRIDAKQSSDIESIDIALIMQSNSMMRVMRGLERKSLGRSALRGILSSKQANKNYYKGKGAPSAGKFIDNKGPETLHLFFLQSCALAGASAHEIQT